LEKDSQIKKIIQTGKNYKKYIINRYSKTMNTIGKEQASYQRFKNKEFWATGIHP